MYRMCQNKDVNLCFRIYITSHCSTMTANMLSILFYHSVYGGEVALIIIIIITMMMIIIITMMIIMMFHVWRNTKSVCALREAGVWCNLSCLWARALDSVNVLYCPLMLNARQLKKHASDRSKRNHVIAFSLPEPSHKKGGYKKSTRALSVSFVLPVSSTTLSTRSLHPVLKAFSSLLCMLTTHFLYRKEMMSATQLRFDRRLHIVSSYSFCQSSPQGEDGLMLTWCWPATFFLHPGANTDRLLV